MINNTTVRNNVCGKKKRLPANWKKCLCINEKKTKLLKWLSFKWLSTIKHCNAQLHIQNKAHPATRSGWHLHMYKVPWCLWWSPNKIDQCSQSDPHSHELKTKKPKGLTKQGEKVHSKRNTDTVDSQLEETSPSNPRSHGLRVAQRHCPKRVSDELPGFPNTMSGSHM